MKTTKITETLDAKILMLLNDYGIEGADDNADLKDDIKSLFKEELEKAEPKEREPESRSPFTSADWDRGRNEAIRECRESREKILK